MKVLTVLTMISALMANVSNAYSADDRNADSNDENTTGHGDAVVASFDATTTAATAAADTSTMPLIQMSW